MFWSSFILLHLFLLNIQGSMFIQIQMEMKKKIDSRSNREEVKIFFKPVGLTDTG